MNNFTDYCFACSPRNPYGLKLSFEFSSEQAIAQWVVQPQYQGWRKILHGGITATILDEAMAKCLEYKGYNAFTAEMTTRYYKNISIGEKIIVRAWLKEEKREKIFYMVSEIKDSNGQILARAEGKYFKFNIEKLKQ